MNKDKIIEIEKRFDELEKLLADQDTISDQKKYQELAKEYSDATPIVQAFRAYKEEEHKIQDCEKVISEETDAEFVGLAKSELKEHKEELQALEDKLIDLTTPKKEEKNRNLIIEIRAGTGGEEASLFAGDLYRMYNKFADKKGWKVEMMDMSPSETGGFKEVIFSVSGKGAEKHLQYESGAHRVQRVPTTEASGRIHTSAATVAILFEPEELEDIEIDPQDLRVDIFRSSGPGGQSVNTTDSAVRLTHLPTGIVVQCQDERSQLKNKYKAMRVLKARIADKQQAEADAAASEVRKLKVGSGDRSEKIRTYNYPDRRVTDHRIGFTTHKLQYVMDGDLDEICEALNKAADQEDVDL